MDVVTNQPPNITNMVVQKAFLAVKLAFYSYVII